MLKEIIRSILLSLVFLLFSISFVTYSSAQTCIDGDVDGYGLNGDASCPNVGVDCNDNDLAINPGAVEGPFGDGTCSDGSDNDCDGLADGADIFDCSDPDVDDDGDTYTENQGDCNDGNITVYPNASLICDGLDNNCDGNKDFDTDEDKDGDGEPWCAGDCNDNDPNRSHNILEGPYGDPKCSDFIDNDCDNVVDASDSQCKDICTDVDGDGYGYPGHSSCTNGSATDCNDNDININPGAADTDCNGGDDNCTGTADDGYVVTPTNCGVGSCAANGQLECQSGAEVNTCIPGVPVVESPIGSPECGDGADNDCDGLTDGVDSGCAPCTDNDQDGYGSNNDPTCQFAGVDCDDGNAAINPGAADDVCDGLDNNCSGIPDDEYTPNVIICGTGVCMAFGQVVCNAGVPEDKCTPLAQGTEGPYGDVTCDDFIDNDCDGLTDGLDVFDCSDPDVDDDGDMFTENQGDCDDTINTVYPNAPIKCDGLDNNCDGNKDFMTDEDKDGDGEPWCAGDCDDNDPNRSHHLVEGPYLDATCSDFIDNDCDSRVDVADSQCRDICTDVDRDGYGNPGHRFCTNGSATDCNDNNAAINPEASDTDCNGVDDNCSGTADDGYVVTPTNCGVGSCAVSGQLECQNGVEVDTCVPGTPVVESPIGSPECEDGADNDCDGLTDAADYGCADCTDNDQDGYGSNGDITCLNGTAIDCNDNDSNINPGASDVNCNEVDDNCTGTADDGYVVTMTNCGIGACAATGQLECHNGAEVNNCVPFSAGTEGPYPGPTCSDGSDNDCDGLTDGSDVFDCSDPDIDDDGDSYTENQGDCDDTDPQVAPGAPLICDGKDNNCDGNKDFMTDEDKDGDGVPWCAKDCDDNDAMRYPGNPEGPRDDATCSDAIDNDCDNKVDIVDSECAPPSCNTIFTPRDGPHIFDLLDPADDTVIASPCSWCHTDELLGTGSTDQRVECQRCHADPGDTSDPLNGILKDPINPNAYPGSPPYGFGTALNVNLHSSTVVGTKYGNWDMDCLTCHNPHQQEQDNIHGTSYGKYIKEYICFDNPVTGLNIEEIVEFTAATGEGSFTDGAPQNENICEMCHTQTNYHRNDGSSIEHNDGTNCTECHLHAEGFKPSCGICHTVPPPTGTHLIHFGGTKDDAEYGSTNITNDFSGQETVYLMDCGNCHPMDALQHINGVPNSGNGTAEIELYNPNAPAGSLKALNPPTATYTPGLTVFTDEDGFKYTQGTCSNVYCHSVTGFSTTGPIPEPLPWVYPLQYDPPWEDFVVTTTQYQSPVWGVDSLGCDGCHGYPITTECKPNPITGECTEVSAGAGDSHAWIDMFGELNLHAWNMKVYFAPLQCNNCHYNTVRDEAPWLKDNFSVFFDDIAIYNNSTHVNGLKDVIFTPDSVEYQKRFGSTYQDLSSAVFDTEEKTCANVSCHKSQTLVKWGAPYRWDNETECNVCHNY